MNRALLFSLFGLTGLSFLLSACSDSQLSNDCSRYRKGMFYYHFKDSDRVSHYTVARTDSIQTETNADNGNVARYKIHWINNCSYELRFIEGTEKLPQEILGLKRKMVLQTTILSGNKTFYLFRSTSNASDKILQDTIWLKR